MLSNSQNETVTSLTSGILEDLNIFHKIVERSCMLHKISARVPRNHQDAAQLIWLGLFIWMGSKNITMILF